jgi:polyphosphate kinase
VSAPERTREQTQAPDLREASLYSNRELSWLAFDDRVLQLAENEALPLLERAKFSAIFSSNLDEFFMIRVAGLHDQIDAGVEGRGPDGMTANETLDRVRSEVLELTERQQRGFSEVLQPALAEHGIRIVRPEDVPESEQAKLTERFERQIFPVLTPLAVGPARPFPYISNLSLSLAVLLRDPVTDTTTFARVKVPKEILGRLVEVGGGDDEALFVPLEAVIAANLDALFPGMEILQHGAFRVTRDADVDVSDEADDLLRAVETELRRRRLGEVIRLELERGMDPALREQLVEALKVEERDIYEQPGPLDLGDLMDVYKLRGHQALRYPPWSGVTQGRLQGDDDRAADIFAAMRQGDVLVHHPYDSFNSSVERFVEQAVEDPDVLAIKQTVYRTSDDSPLVPALIRATERGKQAVCLVELKARFDEQANIGWARRLEESGVHVTYGIPGLKTHAKAILVIRREGDGVRHYVHVGTGNYHPTTARLYTDFGLFTCDPDIGADVADMFNLLTGYARPPRPRRVSLAPQYLREGVLDEIRHTIEAHSEEHPARIRMKMNSLVDPRCIRALYRASQAGVRVELNVRGICCLRPGVPGISENIRVVSIVGRFLEHSRVFQFERGGERTAWIGSADLMPRNLDRRVELVAPVTDRRLGDELAEVLELCFRDTVNSWELREDGEWARVEGGESGEEVDVHRDLMARHAALASESPAQQEGDRAAI